MSSLKSPKLISLAESLEPLQNYVNRNTHRLRFLALLSPT